MMVVMLSVVVPVAVALLAGKTTMSIKFNYQAKKPFAPSKSTTESQSHKTPSNRAPEPIKGFFNHILKYRKPFLRFKRTKSVGQRKRGIDKDWMKVKGEQHATTEKPVAVFISASINYNKFNSNILS